MRIVIVTDWFSEKMGYAENFLPMELSAIGADVHVITSNVQPYFNTKFYSSIYEPFIGSGIVDCGVKKLNGFTLHRLPHSYFLWRLRIPGLINLIRKLDPDIVQTFDTCSLTTLEVTFIKPFFHFKLFLQSHLHASVVNLTRPIFVNFLHKIRWFIYANSIGKLVSKFSVKNFPISKDAAEIVTNLFGYCRDKVDICSLGVDTSIFFGSNGSSKSQQERSFFRHKIGVEDGELLCIYTGRFTADKGTTILADAISSLVSRDFKVKGLFVGGGDAEVTNYISTRPGCIVHPFVSVRDLADFYRASDVGVWPKQESTSQLDAMACGLPIILSNQVEVSERIDGSGFTYEEGDSSDLAKTIILMLDHSTRKNLGLAAQRKIKDSFSWKKIALDRFIVYQDALRH